MEVEKTTKWVHHSLFLTVLVAVLLLGLAVLDYHRDNSMSLKEAGKVWILPEYNTIGQVAEFEITAYDAWSAQSINVAKYRDGRTALNRPAVAGYTIAVDPRVIPFDSFVFIPGVGWRVAEDVGGAIKGYRLDVLMETKKDAMKFGRQKLYALWIPPKAISVLIEKKIVRKQTIPKKKAVKPKKTTKK